MCSSGSDAAVVRVERALVDMCVCVCTCVVCSKCVRARVWVYVCVFSFGRVRANGVRARARCASESVYVHRTPRGGYRCVTAWLTAIYRTREKKRGCFTVVCAQSCTQFARRVQFYFVFGHKFRFLFAFRLQKNQR